MAGVYGDMLLCFPEQMRPFSVYEMNPRINGGWDKVTDEHGEVITQIVFGVFQNTRGGNQHESNGNLVETDGCEFWTVAENLGGKFLDFRGDVYRLKDTNRWCFEGGFFRYSVDKVVGNNATESDDASWNIGGNSFG